MSMDMSPARHEAMTAGPSLLEARDVKVHFPIRRGFLKRVVGHVRAVDGVSLAIRAGETLACRRVGCGRPLARRGARAGADAGPSSVQRDGAG